MGAGDRTPLAFWLCGARPTTLSSVPVLFGNALAVADGHQLNVWVDAPSL